MPDGDTQNSLAEDAGSRSKSRLRGPLLIAAPVVVLVGALAMYFTGGRYESTDNAELQTGLVGIAADVSGKVVAIEVHENQLVHKGDVLFRIDPANAAAAVAQAEANLAAARAGVGSTRADYQENVSDTASARAQLELAESEAARQKAAYAQGISSKAQYDAAATAVTTARQAIAAAQAKADSKRAMLAGSISGSTDALPEVRAAAALLDAARINLQRTTVYAPIDGVVTKVNQLQLGSYVSASRPVFMLAGAHFWVEANFKENQLRYMRVGQPATVEIDAFPDLHLKGKVASFSPGTGNSFSILPAENATGNWVKVVQRLPVEIDIDEVPQGVPLHAGLSAEVEVDTGHKRSL